MGALQLTVTGAVLGSAVLHATWNAIAHALHDKLLTFTLIALTYTVGGGVLALLVAGPSRPAQGTLAPLGHKTCAPLVVRVAGGTGESPIKRGGGAAEP